MRDESKSLSAECELSASLEMTIQCSHALRFKPDFSLFNETAYMEHGGMWTHFLKSSVCDVKICFKNRNTKWFPRWSQICALDMSFVTKKPFILSRQKSEILQGYIAVYMWCILSFLDSEIKKCFLRENFLRTHVTCIRTPLFLFQKILTFGKCISHLSSRAPRFNWDFSMCKGISSLDYGLQIPLTPYKIELFPTTHVSLSKHCLVECSAPKCRCGGHTH
jgi:hypothetical protein